MAGGASTSATGQIFLRHRLRKGFVAHLGFCSMGTGIFRLRGKVAGM